MNIFSLITALQGFQSVPPMDVHVRQVEAARAVAEFEAICLAPHFDLNNTREAVAKSTIQYIADTNVTAKGRGQLWWQAPEGIATLYLPSAGRQWGYVLPQCRVEMGGERVLSRADLLALVRPIVERYATGPITERTDRWPSLEWRSPGGEYTFQLDIDSLAWSEEGSSQLSFSVSTYSVAGRAAIDKLMKTSGR